MRATRIRWFKGRYVNIILQLTNIYNHAPFNTPENYEVMKPCACGCGELIHSVTLSSNKPIMFKHGHINRGKRAEQTTQWKGGECKNGRYLITYSPDHHFAVRGYIPKHRKVYEDYYNCVLLPWVVIHHIDGNKVNNDISNLQPFSKSQHMRLEGTLRRFPKGVLE